MRGALCAPLLLLVCLLLPLLLLDLCNRFVDSSPYLAFHPFPPEAALGRQIIKVSIAFYAGQRSLLFFAEQGLFQFGLAIGVCGCLQGPGGSYEWIYEGVVRFPACLKISGWRHPLIGGASVCRMETLIQSEFP